MLQPYSIGLYKESLRAMEFFVDFNGQIVLIEDDILGQVYLYDGKDFIVGNAADYQYFDASESEKMSSIRPATRKELKDAGLWDMVINKDNFSCVEDQLECYLEVASNFLKV